MRSDDTVIRRISVMLDARATCAEHGGNGHWFGTWSERLRAVEREQLPSGSGFDSGTSIDVERSLPDCIVFHTQFHHMDDDGYYCEWTSHTIRVRPSFIHGFHLTVSGPNTRDIKDYIHQTFEILLRETYRATTAEEIAANIPREVHDKAEEEKDRAYAREQIARIESTNQSEKQS